VYYQSTEEKELVEIHNNLATYLLKNVLDTCRQDTKLEEVCLHVHVTNNQALNLYRCNGFSVESELKGYYELNERVNPPDAFLLKLRVIK
jgi:ribosomal protein S18 acetylase RimI-like enzyme